MPHYSSLISTVSGLRKENVSFSVPSNLYDEQKKREKKTVIRKIPTLCTAKLSNLLNKQNLWFEKKLMKTVNMKIVYSAEMWCQVSKKEWIGF